MKKTLMTLALSLSLASPLAFAVPTAQQVEQSMMQGNWQKADSQLSEVLDAHPKNAHAHYPHYPICTGARSRGPLQRRPFAAAAGEIDRSFPELHRSVALRRDAGTHSSQCHAGQHLAALG